MIEVRGTAKLDVNFSIELKMSVEEWDALSESKQDEIIDNTVDWMEAGRSAEIDEIQVDDVVKL